MALGRHYALRLLYARSFLAEFWFGVIAFLRWSPQLGRNLFVLFPGLSRGTARTASRLSRAAAADIPGFCINLEARQDRRRLVSKSLTSVGLTRVARFEALPNALGILGCTKSHIAVLEQAKSAGNSLTLVCEDDVEFVRSQGELEAIVSEFEQHPGLDVLCLAYRLRAPRLPISQALAVANNIQTASCYMVKFEALDVILKSLKESEQMLEAGVSPRTAANDIHWKKYQTQGLFFAIPRRRVARQRPSFSDIAQRFKNYKA